MLTPGAVRHPGVITVVLDLRFISPGDPANVLLPPDIDPEVRAQVIAGLGLSESLYVQYWEFISGVPFGDLGLSLVIRTPVSARAVARPPATLELAIAATVAAVVIAIPLSVLSATRRHEPTDYGATMFSLVGISTPNFWLGVMLILVLAVQLDAFPISQRPIGLDGIAVFLVGGDVGAAIRGFGTWLWHITFPVITLETYFTALITRLICSEMLDQLGQTYVRATRAKGLPEALVRYKHALRNTFIPAITAIGLRLGTLVGGAVITKAVFAWPRLGSLIINSINARDRPALQGSLIVVAVGFVLVSILVDALYAYANPQVAYD